MKKFARVIALLVLTLCLGLALTACGDESKAEGKYVCTEDGVTVTIELKDGKCTYDNDGDGMKGTYKIDGNKITLTFTEEYWSDGDDPDPDFKAVLTGTIKPGKSLTIDFGDSDEPEPVTFTYKK